MAPPLPSVLLGFWSLAIVGVCLDACTSKRQASVDSAATTDGALQQLGGVVEDSTVNREFLAPGAASPSGDVRARADAAPTVNPPEQVSAYVPAGQVGTTPVFSWVNSIESGVANVLPDDRWSLPYQWAEGESSLDVWMRGSVRSRPLSDNPVGLRAIRPWNNYWPKRGRPNNDSKWGFRDELVLNPHTTNARSLGFVAPWFDDWRTVGSEIQLQLAEEMFNAGGEVDYLIMDWEDYNSPYDIERDLKLVGVTLDDYRIAVTQDPRWPRLREELNAAAVAAGYDSTLVNFEDNLADMPAEWNRGHSPKGWVWSRYMHSKIIETLEDVLYHPWARFFPNVQASDYQKFLNGDWENYVHATWSVDAPTAPLHIGSGTRWVVGTHQAIEAYGRRELDGNLPIQIHAPASFNPPRLPLVKWNPRSGMDDKFAVLIKTLRKLRAAVALQDENGKPPIMVWISGDQYPSSLWVPAGGAEDYQWYAEAIFHLGLHDVEAWLVWNTFRMTDGSSEQRVNAIVTELERFVGGFSDAQVLVRTTVDWDVDRFVLSGMRVGGWDVFRFTPGEPGIVANDSPFTFRFASDSLTVSPIPSGQVYSVPGSASEIGFWVVAPANLSPAR